MSCVFVNFSVLAACSKLNCPCLVFQVDVKNYICTSFFNMLLDARLDKFWSHQAVKYDFTADLTGTGNRSEEVIS